MGKNQSKTIVDITNQVIPQVLIQHMQACNSAAGLNQDIVNTGLMFGSNISQSSNISVSCVANFQVDNTVISDIANNIQQQAESQGIALLDALTTNKAEANLILKNKIAPVITTSMMQQVAQNLKQNQAYINRGFMIGSTLTQDSSVVVKAIMDSIASTNLTTDLINNTKQKDKTISNNPLSFLTDIAWYWVLLIMVIVVSIIAGVVLIFTV